MPKTVWGGAVLAFVGVIWLTLANAPSEDAPHPILGNFLEFLAMVCAAGYTITMKKLTERYSPLFLTMVQAVIGAIFFFPFIFLGTKPHHFDLPAFSAIFYLGAVVTMGAYGLYNYALKYVPASRAAACVNLIPIFAVFLGWLLLGETLKGGQFFAGAMILAGVYLTQSQQSWTK